MGSFPKKQSNVQCTFYKKCSLDLLVLLLPFSLALQEHNILYTILSEDANAKLTQSQAGKVLKPATAWNCKAVQLGWQLVWSLNGLQPKRAVVFMTQDVTIPDHKAFVIQ